MSWNKNYLYDLSACDHVFMWDVKNMAVGYARSIDDYWAHVEASSRAFVDGKIMSHRTVAGKKRPLVQWIECKLTPLPIPQKRAAREQQHIFYDQEYYMSRCPFCYKINYHLFQKLQSLLKRLLQAI